MIQRFIFLINICFCTSIIAQVASSDSCKPVVKPFTVVELFSSEGCYDCPAAEVILNNLVAEQKKSGENIILIAEHVDYWDDLVDGENECKGNWVDKYSTSVFTARQFVYTKQLANRSVTPQFIINGKSVVSGADGDTLKTIIKELKNDTAFFGICLKLNVKESDFSKRKVVVDFEIKKSEQAPQGFRTKIVAQVQLFVVEDNIVTKPVKGENCNKILHHENIARAFNGHTLYGKASKGKIELTLPLDVKVENCTVLGFVQNLMNQKIMGATTGFKLK